MLLSRSEVAACQTSLLHFTSTTFLVNKRVPFLQNIHQVRVTDALERVLLGMCPRLIINVPPRSGKTELAVVNFIAWALGLYPDAEFIHVSYSGRLAGNNTWNARALITSQVYSDIFPAVGIRADSNARDEFRTTLGGVIYATGSEGSLTGYGAGKMRDGFGGCFPLGTRVWTEGGFVPIERLVRDRQPVNVWSSDLAGNMELRAVTGWHENPPNEIVRVSCDDGSTLDCTPDHRIWTENRGWVRADSLCEDDRLPVVDGGVKGTQDVGINPEARSGRLEAPAVLAARAGGAIEQGNVGLRLGQDGAQIGSDAPLADDRLPACHGSPCFAAPDLVDDGSGDAIAPRQIDGGHANGVVDRKRGIIAQDGARMDFGLAKRPMPLAVADILGARSIPQVDQPVIRGLAVDVASIPAPLRPDKGAQDGLMNIDQINGAALGEIDAKVAFPVIRWPQNAGGLDALVSDPAKIADGVSAFISGYRKPVLVERIRHDDVTFCLTVAGYHNFTVEGGWIVKNCIIIDDPHKAGDVNYPVKRTRVLDFFKETLESRKNRPDTPIILIMQRLHEDDLTGFLLAGGNGETWEHIVIPALDDAGLSFWERQFPAEKLRKMEAASSYVFAGQYQQRPAPKGGGMLKAEWFEIVPAAPAGVRWIRAWDLAASKEAESAFTAGVLMGVSKEGTFYVKDVTRLQGSAGEVKRTIAATASQDGRAVHGSLPQDPGAGGKAWAEDLIRAVAGYVYRATPESGDKETRAMPFAAQAEAGNVKLVRGPWNRAYLDELKLFPTGKFKDQVDASSRAFNELAGPVAVAEERETGFY